MIDDAMHFGKKKDVEILALSIIINIIEKLYTLKILFYLFKSEKTSNYLISINLSKGLSYVHILNTTPHTLLNNFLDKHTM